MPPAKRKRKRTKKTVVETEEQKRLRLEMAALKATEEKKLAADRKREELFKKFQEEIEMTRVNIAKINARWLAIAREHKVSELQEEITVLAQMHEREVDRKDAMIASLGSDLDAAEEQHQIALRSHLENVEALMNLHNHRMRTLQREFAMELRDLDQEFAKEREAIEKQHTKCIEEIEVVVSAMTHAYSVLEAEAREEFTHARDDIKNKSSEELSALRITLEANIEDLEHHFDAAHQSYVAETDAQTLTFKTLTIKDANNARKIEMQARKVQRLQESLSHWRTKMANNVRECEERNRALKEEKDAITRHFSELKNRMNSHRAARHRRLVELTTHAANATKVLEERVTDAERILKLSEMCRGLECEQEQILPFRDSSLTDEDRAEILKRHGGNEEAAEDEREILHSYAAGEDGRALSEWETLDRFFQRHNNVLLDTILLQDEEKALSAENEDLRALLKKYLEGISVGEGVLRSDNPLLTINGATGPLAQPRSNTQVQPVVIEASVYARTAGRRM